MTDDDYEWDGEDNDDEAFEPIGSCDNCGTNLYDDDCYHLDGEDLCGQCYWWATEATR